MGFMDRYYLTGKTAIVTGSGQGIGKATVTAFAEAGANVVLAGMNIFSPEESEEQLNGVARDLEKLGAKTLPIVIDMRNEDEVEAMLEKALSAFGQVDVHVNNVAGGVIEGPFLGVTQQLLEDTIKENFTTAFLGCRIVGAHMAERRSGAIVNFTSLDGRGPTPLVASYAASKAAVVSLTQTVAAELGPYGVRVNAVAPYLTLTENITRGIERNPEAAAEGAAKAMLGRFGRTDEMAALVLFLASDASSYITGQIIHCSGGALPGSSVRLGTRHTPGLAYPSQESVGP